MENNNINLYHANSREALLAILEGIQLPEPTPEQKTCSEVRKAISSVLEDLDGAFDAIIN